MRAVVRCGGVADRAAAVNFEGQAAIELETIAAEGVNEAYPVEVAGDLSIFGGRSKGLWRTCGAAWQQVQSRRGFTMPWRRRSWKCAEDPGGRRVEARLPERRDLSDMNCWRGRWPGCVARASRCSSTRRCRRTTAASR